MKINRRGVTRIVFIFKTIVVKIPNFLGEWNHFLRGIIGNIEEGRTWKYNSGKYENGKSYLLCPVLWCSWGGWLLVMRKADLIDDDNDSVFSCAEHWEHFKGDDSISNYGVLNGRLVKIDYADLDNYWGEDFKPLNK